mgnify:CR=1 FL=1
MVQEYKIDLGDLFEVLPEYPKFKEGIRRAPKREFTLTQDETELALKNALRYVPQKWHEVLAPEFLNELLTKGRIYGYRFRPNTELSGKPIDEYIVDFFCNKLQLAIECDGYSHELLDVYNKDVKKTKRINDLGIYVLRCSDYQVVNDIDNVLRAIEDYIFKFEENNFTPPSIPPC